MTKNNDLVKRHSEITERIQSTRESISTLETSLAAPIDGGDVDKQLKQAAKNRADLVERQAELDLLERMLADVSTQARANVDEIESQHEKDYKQWEAAAAQSLTELLKTDDAQKCREFLGVLSWLFQTSGQARYNDFFASSAFIEKFEVSGDIAESLAKKSGAYSDGPVMDHDLRDQLREIGDESLQPVYAAQQTREGVTHVTASQEDRDAMREKVKAAGRKGGFPKANLPDSIRERATSR
jgi:predicted RNA-binding Zn ribbon-like protein